jgi:soluble lytic murein transglycosylase-like protein
MPTTASWLGVDPWVPEQNLDGGARYLRMMYDRYGRWDYALAAYNAGPTRVDAAGPGIPDILETQLYVVRVLDRYATLLG